MEDKFQNKYRIPSARLQSWDYASEGSYFITICTHNREHFFGEIENGKMKLSNVGVIADLMWYEMKNHIKNVELGEFVIMPNHIHCILILDNNVNTLQATSEFSTSEKSVSLGSDVANNVSTKNEFMSAISPKPNSISTIIRSYKSGVTKHANRLGFDFKWQTRFHDHIIRDVASFEKIQNYIATNPENWKDDKFYESNS